MVPRLHYLILALILSFTATYSQKTSGSEIDLFHSINTSILDLYKKFPIVAIGEGQHNSALTFEWLTTLVNENEFPDIVKNIVVEFGASEYQWVMDDFVNNKDVPDSLFKKCWRETTQIMVWDNPIYEQFFKEIRKINKNLPKQKRIRVLLGDPSFGSKKIHDEHTFYIIENEVLKKNQTALLIYGDLHFVRRDIFTNYATPTDLKKEFLNVIQFLEIHYPGKAFSVWGSVNTTDSLTNQIIHKENIQIPSLLHAADTELGNLDFRIFYPYPTDYRTDNLGNDIETAAHIQLPLKQIVDGIIFRGSWEAQNYLAPRPDDIYADTVYLNELIRREQIANIPPYRTRLYFYKIFGSKEFLPFANALDNEDLNTIDLLYQPLKVQIPEANQMAVLNHTGYFYLRKKDIKKSISIFSLAVREYPNEFNPYDSLGDAYAANNEIEKALHCYEEALKINPNSNATRVKIEKLKTN